MTGHGVMEGTNTWEKRIGEMLRDSGALRIGSLDQPECVLSQGQFK